MTKVMQFLNAEDGAITVDWVVLTAAIIGLGLVVVTIIAAGTTNVSSGVGASLNDATPAELNVPFF
ncbi:MAG: hypothetical protein HKN27_01385 [Silicimonas sp.]|nr:hypothetical protein [Silicimonas sp.]